MRLLAVGDSITAGCGTQVGAIPPRSWAAWVALALDAELTTHAYPGATAPEIADRTLPISGQWDLGLCYVGINDALSHTPGTDTVEAVKRIGAALAGSCSRVLIVTPPETVGRMPVPFPYGAGRRSRVLAVVETVQRVAAETGAVTVPCPPLTGRWRMTCDRVHPTSAGQLTIAKAALAALGEPDLLPVVSPQRLPFFYHRHYLRSFLKDAMLRTGSDLRRLVR